ncbi:MAG TPA: hypothetical protein DCK95_03630 [Anaerolineaceae bacterium]|nr:hypothetical protein [Anaerolineaceae bacterium]
MKKNWLVIGIVTLIVVAVGAYFWATTLMDSLFEYRSPLATDAPVAQMETSQPLTRRVVIVLVDALREDTAMDVQVMPFLNELRSQAAWATMHSQTPSYSAPSWTTILTGAWPDINDGQSANPPDEDSVRTFTQDDIFAAAERAGLHTAVSGFFWFEDMLANSGVDAGFYTPGEDDSADRDVMKAAVPWLEEGTYDLMLIHLDQVDYAGHHEGGAKGAGWQAAAGRVDDMLREIVTTMDLEQDTLLIFSDHGQIDQGGHGGQEAVTLVEPFLMLGAGTTPGYYSDIQMVDIAPTVATLLGTQIPASSQGRILTEMLTISEEQAAVLQDGLDAQQAQLLQEYQVAIGADVQLQSEDGASQPFNVKMDAIRAQRLDQERTPRMVIAILLAAIPLTIMIKKKEQNWKWFVGGTICYLVIFNLMYAVIMHKTYSLSSLVSAGDLILSTALYSGIALLTAWLLVMLARKDLSKGSAHAAGTSLNLIFIVLYVLALPVLWSFYRNGALISWTLPEFGSMYLSFLSLIQIIFVALFGLLLTGGSALIAHRKRNNGGIDS